VELDKENGSSADDPTTRFVENHRASAVKRAPTAALRAIQQTSSAIYEVATPFLYRYLRVTSPQIMNLLRLFYRVAEVQEVIMQDRRKDIHPLDYHLYHRLQWALSSVRQIHLTLDPYFGMRDDWLSDYTELCTVLRRLGRPHLWPALDKVSIRVRDRHGGKTADSESYLAYEGTMIRAIGPTLHPTFLDIEFPDPPRDKHFDTVTTDVRSSFYHMRADHVTVSNITDTSQDIPSARLSLSIEFSARFGTFVRSYSSDPTNALRMRYFFLESNPQYVPRLTLIGIERGLEGLPSKHIRTQLCIALGQSQSAHDRRSYKARYRIRPWNSPEGGDWDVWHSYDETISDQ
jgi:hypothetical protein